MKNIKPAVIKTYLTKVCLGAIVFALAGCGHSFIPPTDAEVKSLVESPSPELLQIIANTPPDPGQTMSKEQANAILAGGAEGVAKLGIKVSGITNGTPRVSGATEVNMGIPDGTDLYPTRVTINAYGMNRTIDFYFYKNDHNEWKLTPENN